MVKICPICSVKRRRKRKKEENNRDFCVRAHDFAAVFRRHGRLPLCPVSTFFSASARLFFSISNKYLLSYMTSRAKDGMLLWPA
jgi:hypothetical protein